MAWQPNIPQPTDQLSTSQGDILGNFQALDPVVNGIISFPATAPAPVIPAGIDALYGAIPTAAPLTGLNELFIKKQIPAAPDITFPMTAALFANDGYTYLPSGILIKWGYAAPALPNPVTITYDPTIPFTQVFSVIANPVRPNPLADPNIFVTVDQNSVFTNVANFQAWTSPRTTTGSQAIQLFYIAIGKAF